MTTGGPKTKSDGDDIEGIQIRVVQRQRAKLTLMLQWIAFQAVLVAALWISKEIIGGSILMDTVSVCLTIAMFYRLMRQVFAGEWTMDVHECRRWLNDGAPRDVRAWRAKNGRAGSKAA